MPIETDDQARALAQCICAIRPEWNVKSFYTLMLKEHHAKNPLLARPFEDIIMAATRKASDPNVKFPVLIWRDGAHWNADPKTGYDTTVPADPCPDHPTYNAATCGGCQGDINAGLRPREYKGLHFDPPTT